MDKLKNYYDLVEKDNRKVYVDFINNNTIIFDDGDLKNIKNDYIINELNRSRNLTLYFSKKDNKFIFALMRIIFDTYDEAAKYADDVIQQRRYCVEINKNGYIEEI